MKSAFIAIAAHELRTPLTSILGYLELLVGGDAGLLSAQQTEYLQIMETSARRLMRITNDLLDVTRIEAGHMELVLQPTDLISLVNSVIAEVLPLLEDKSQHLVLRAPDHLPQALCDSARAAQIIGNLLNNARSIPHRPAPSPSRLSKSADAGFLQISIAARAVASRQRIRLGSSDRSSAPAAMYYRASTAPGWACISPDRWLICTAATSGSTASPSRHHLPRHFACSGPVDPFLLICLS